MSKEHDKGSGIHRENLAIFSISAQKGQRCMRGGLTAKEDIFGMKWFGGRGFI